LIDPRRMASAPRWIRINGIDVPVEYALQRQLMRRLYLHAVATWEDVSGRPTTEKHLEELASQLNAESAITLFSALSTFQHNRRLNLDGLDADQISAATELLSPSVAAEVIDKLRKGHRHRWLHEEQLLAAMRLVILHGQPGPMKASPDRDVLGELLLGINDHLRLEGPSDEPKELQRMRMVLRPMGLLASEQERYVIPRFQDLLLIRARHEQERGGMDLDAAFEQATGGLSPEEYLAAALVYVMPFVTVSDVRSLAASNYREILAQYEKRHRNADKARLCADQFVGSISWYRDQFRELETRALAYWDYMPFKRRPLIRLEENVSPLPISFSLLMQKLATGPYWLLHHHLGQVDPAHGVQNLNALMGRVFEGYAEDLLDRTFIPVADARFVPGSAMTTDRAGVKKPDGVMQQGSDFVVFETSATVLSDAAIVNSDPSAFLKEIATKHQSKVVQLGKAIEGLSTRLVKAPGVDISKVRAIYPVLLLLHPFPHFRFTVEPLRQAISTGPVGHGRTQLMSLTIVSAEEMEMIEPVLAGGVVAFGELLVRRNADEISRDTSFKNFLLSSGIKGVDDNQNMKQLYDERLKSEELDRALHELFVFDDDSPGEGA
jgi:hypothetical protein